MLEGYAGEDGIDGGSEVDESADDGVSEAIVGVGLELSVLLLGVL